MAKIYTLRRGREVTTGSTVSGDFVLLADHAALQARLKRYADHDQDCLAWNRDTRPCTCGYSEANPGGKS